MSITSWTIDIRVNIQIWLLYRRYKSEWYNFWWATIQDIAACACKVWTLFGQACGQEECSQTTTMTTMTTTTTTMTDKSGLHRLATDILSWAKKHNTMSQLINSDMLSLWSSWPLFQFRLVTYLALLAIISGSFSRAKFRNYWDHRTPCWYHSKYVFC